MERSVGSFEPFFMPFIASFLPPKLGKGFRQPS
jgi:hypothetical protein